MSTNLRKFLDTVAADPALQKKVLAALASAQGGDSSEALSGVAADCQIPVSASEFRAYAADPSSGELDPAQLQSISGGLTTWKNLKSPFDTSP